MKTIAGSLLLLVALASEPSDKVPPSPTLQNSASEQRIGSYVIEYDARPENPVVQLTYGDWRAPTLEIFGDGLLVVTRSVNSGQSGMYELQLTSAEMNALLLYLADCGLMEFDKRAISKRMEESWTERKQKAELDGQPLTFRQILCGSTTSIRINLTRYRGVNQNSRTIRNLHKEISWYHPEVEAQNYPEIEEIRKLAEAFSFLKTFITTAHKAGK